MRLLPRFGLCFALLACSRVGAAQQSRATDALTRLQREVAATPSSVAANRALGIWYYKNERFDESRAPLEQARKLDPLDGVSALYAGLAAEHQKDWAAAKAAYTSYIAVGKTSKVRKDIRARLVSVAREEGKAEAKRALANEAVIAQQPGSSTTIAVPPLLCSACDPSIAPLARGLADLMINDLSKKPGLTLLERDRLQAMSDEIALSQNGRVDATTAVRAGRLIRAGRIVQGSIVSPNGREISLNANVVGASDREITSVNAKADGVLDNLFALEKTLVFGVFDALGITLTPRERQDVDRRPTNSLQAFLAYSRGLVAEDEGKLDEAARFFENARSLDPGFGAALQRAQSTAAAAQAAPPAKVESNLKSSSEGQIASAAERGVSSVSNSASLGSTLNNVVGAVNPTTTNTVSTSTSAAAAPPPTTGNAAAEKTGTDQPAPRTGQVTIILRKP